MTQRTAQNLHTATQINDNTRFSHKIITALHFTALHNTSLYCTSLNFTPHFSRLCTFGRFVATLQSPSLLLSYNYCPKPFYKNMCDLQGKTASVSAGSLSTF